MNIVKIKSTQLAAPLNADDTSFTVNEFIDSKGEPVDMADIGAFGVVVLTAGDEIEMVKFDDIDQNTDGSATLHVATLGRDIDPTSPYAGHATGLDLSTGAEVQFSNDPLTMSRFVQLDNENIFSVTPKTSAGDPTDPTELTRKAYVDALVLGTLTTIDVIVPAKAGATIAAGQLIYLDESTGKWKLSDADVVSTVDNVLLGIAQGAGTDGNAITNGVLLQGVDAHQSGMTIGNVMYASNTPGAIASTPGTETVTVGIAKDATNLYFAPRFNMQLTEAGNEFLLTVTGMSFAWNGDTAPTGFLLEDGAAYSNGLYPQLLAVLKGKNGLANGTVFTATAATDRINSTAHGLVAGQILLLDTTTTLPAGLSKNTLYYVVNPTTNDFQLALTAGGSAVDITGTGTGVHSYYTSFNVPDSRGRVLIGTGTGTTTLNFDATVTGVNIATEQIVVPSNNWLITGQAVTLAAVGAGALPTGLAAGTYYVIRIDSTHIQLASSLANAEAGTAVNITAVGTGLASLTQTLTARALGDKGGEETHAMTLLELVNHDHHETVNTSGTTSSNPTAPALNPYVAALQVGNNTPQTLPTAIAQGGGVPMNLMPPFGTKNWIIKT